MPGQDSSPTPRQPAPPAPPAAVGAHPWRSIAVLLAVILAAGGLLLRGYRGTDVPRAEPAAPTGDLAAFLDDFADGMRPTGPYRTPTDGERGAAVAALGSLLRGTPVESAQPPLAALGFSVRTGTDRSTGRRYALASSEAATERSWGAYLVDLSSPVRLVIEVPHPNSDLRTEQVGLALLRAVPGSALLVAGAHRRAADGAADVAHRTDSVFHGVSTSLAEIGLPQVQIHGFHDDSLPGTDLVLSAGPGQAGPAVRRAGEVLAGAGFALCRAWEEKCGQLSGTRNEQGAVAAQLNVVFAHVEIGRSVRDSEAQRARMVQALATAFTDPPT